MKSFPQNAALRRHITRQHQSEPKKCDFCNFTVTLIVTIVEDVKDLLTPLLKRHHDVSQSECDLNIKDYYYALYIFLLYNLDL